jgi:UDP-glucose 4-epimerase
MAVCLFAIQHGLGCVILRMARFFPEDDDTDAHPSGENLKAVELLHRRLTVEDAAEAHVVVLDWAPKLGFEVFLICCCIPRSSVLNMRRSRAMLPQ